MLVLDFPACEPEPPRPPRRRSVVVWQPQYDGFTTIAYRNGQAIAGVSGPWSGQYVLIWWHPAQPVRCVELFDSIDAAKAAVVRDGMAATRRWSDALDALWRGAARRPGWLERLRRRWRARWRGAPRAGDRRRDDEETDLRGLNFRALR